MAHETVLFTCSEEMKDALGSYAASTQQSMSEIVREAVAAVIGYDLAGEVKSARRGTKYANAEARKRAMLDRAKARRQLTRDLLAAYDEKERAVIIQALVDSVQPKSDLEVEHHEDGTKFGCRECGKIFRTTKAAEQASSKGCPKCGGSDIDQVS